MNPKDEVNKLHNQLNTERMRGHINFRDLYTEQIDTTTYLSIECREQDTNAITEQLDIESYTYIYLREIEEKDNSVIVRFELKQIELENLTI